MNDTSKNRFIPAIVVGLVVLMAAGSMWYSGPPTAEFFATQELNKKTEETPGLGDTNTLRPATQVQLVQRYVAAYQTRNCAEIAKCTLWVQDRIRVIKELDGEEAQEQSRSELCVQLLAREEGMGQLSILGIDDQYLIPVTATFTIEGSDSGRTDLKVPVAERVWGVFEYSDKSTAPKNENGEAIRSLRAGLNLSANSLALKGSVHGNWEIDFDSISLQW